jgi:hypothetical protein
MVDLFEMVLVVRDLVNSGLKVTRALVDLVIEGIFLMNLRLE